MWPTNVACNNTAASASSFEKSFFMGVRFCLEEPPGVQRLYTRASTPPPTKVTCLSDKEQKDWLKDVQGITEQ